MNESKIVVRYAKALFEFAKDSSMLEQIKSDFDQISSLCMMEDFKTLLKNPTIKPSMKKKLIFDIIEKSASQGTLTFIDLLVQSRREIYLADISRSFINNYNNFKGIKQAVLVTASKIDKENRSKIISIAKKTFNTDIQLKENTNTKIIGGFVLTIEDQQFDASVISKLKKINLEMIQTPVESAHSDSIHSE
ncbi:MAG: ATP synthase F1 subunit delta [Bacteroidales bacterium]|nr:ATP synthase F1 subunit delta [Bacteroidales bacterium]